MLKIEDISSALHIKKLSDGQKQKLKILAFFLQEKELIILDELTNALDKKTILDIYDFLNVYISENPNKLLINITHNLSDLKKLVGNYYLLENQHILKYDNSDIAIQHYIEN